MEYHEKPNTSFETLASLSQKKDNPRTNYIRPKSKQKDTNTTSSEKTFTTQRTNISCSDKHISQQLHVEKQKFQYIINVNTTVCDHKSKHREKYRSRHSQENLWSKHLEYNRDIRERSSIVPKCFRPHCVNSTINRNWGHRQVFWRYNIERHEERNRRYSRIYDIKTRPAHYGHQKKPKKKHCRCRHSKYKNNQENPRVLLSPISSTPLEDDLDDNLSYEDISLTSLKTNIEKVTCKHLKHKHRKYTKHKHRKYTKQYIKEDVKESKLDTLIRRTKERERRLVQQSRRQQSRSINKPLYTSTPVHSECSGDLPMSCDMAISFDSRSTLVLEMQGVPYSPSCPIEDLNSKSSETEKLISYSGYSPGSPIKNEDYVAKVSENNNYKLMNIKNELTMDVGAYSPIHSPDGSAQKCDFSKIRVKKEVDVKAKRLVSPGITHINFKEECGSQIRNIENIKSELDYDG